MLLRQESKNIPWKTSWCMRKHTVHTYKYRIIKRKCLRVRYVHTSTLSTNVILSGETTIYHKNHWATGISTPWGVNGITNNKAIEIYQVLKLPSVSTDLSIKLLLNQNDKNWLINYTYHNNIVSSNKNTELRVHHIL